jgi:hypothetical protein
VVQADGGSFKATQIKEKYATLRFYWKGALSPEADAQVEEIIDLAEARSACTCEVCGEEGRLYSRRARTSNLSSNRRRRTATVSRSIQARFIGR